MLIAKGFHSYSNEGQQRKLSIMLHTSSAMLVLVMLSIFNRSAAIPAIYTTQCVDVTQMGPRFILPLTVPRLLKNQDVPRSQGRKSISQDAVLSRNAFKRHHRSPPLKNNNKFYRRAKDHNAFNVAANACLPQASG